MGTCLFANYLAVVAFNWSTCHIINNNLKEIEFESGGLDWNFSGYTQVAGCQHVQKNFWFCKRGRIS
jgi:hypothetical protein